MFSGLLVDFGMKKLLLILTLLNIGLGQHSDSLINVYTYPDFSNISNPKILSYGDDKVIVAATNSNDEVSNILFLVIDHDGNMVNSTEYPDQNYLIDFVIVPDGSYIIATDYGLWRLVIVDNNFNFSFLTNEFNENERLAIQKYKILRKENESKGLIKQKYNNFIAPSFLLRYPRLLD